MKKKIATALSVLMVVALTATGCGRETVDYDIDGDGSSGGSSDGGTLAAKYGIPDECDTKLDVGDSGLSKIEIYDLDVSYPDASSMDIAYYTLMEVTNESKQTIAEKLFDKDEGIYEYDWENMTKEDIQQQIDWYTNEIQCATDAGYEDDIEWYQEELDEYEDMLSSAPDEYEAAGDYSGDEFVGTMDGRGYQLSFSDNSTDLSMREYSITYRPSEKAENAEGCYWSAMSELNSEDFEDLDNECALTEDEAREIAEDFMEKVGISDMSLVLSDELCWTYYGYTGEDLSIEKDGYYFKYARAINDVTVSTETTWNVDNLMGENASVGIPVESFTINIDSNGILSASWSFFLEATGETEKNVELLTFDEMIDIANETVAEYYTTYPTNYSKVDFSEVELTYYLSETDEDGVFKYTPVWIFSEYDAEYANETYPSQMVVIDATDGSVIDLMSLSKAVGGYYTYEDTTEVEETIIIDDTINEDD